MAFRYGWEHTRVLEMEGIFEFIELFFSKLINLSPSQPMRQCSVTHSERNFNEWLKRKVTEALNRVCLHMLPHIEVWSLRKMQHDREKVAFQLFRKIYFTPNSVACLKHACKRMEGEWGQQGIRKKTLLQFNYGWCSGTPGLLCIGKAVNGGKNCIFIASNKIS